MLKISEIRIPVSIEKESSQKHGKTSPAGAQLEKKIRKILRFGGEENLSVTILRHAVDCRKKPVLFHVYTASVTLSPTEEKKILAKHIPNVSRFEPEKYVFPVSGDKALPGGNRPAVIGAGPAGLFAAYMLALHGYRPILLERGRSMEQRTKDVEHFWKSGELNENSNIQFGEGGAGTYSDGKLTTNAKDKEGRTQFILNTFIETGADPSIAYEFLPHIGTDVLRTCVTSIRNRILSLGGTVLFETLVTGFENKNGKLTGVRILDEAAGKEQVLPCEAAVLAPGHSARDLVRTLYADGIPMEPKAFAVGLRVSHPQTLVNENQYGIPDEKTLQSLHLPAVSYKLTARAASGRGVYSFCMCPGGYIVNASSEKGRLAVNGMSDFARDSARANSAIVVTVGPKEFGGSGVLDGMAFQEALEEKAFSLGEGRIPVEWYPDLKRGVETGEVPGDLHQVQDSEALCIRGEAEIADLASLLPKSLMKDFVEGMEHFDRVIPGFAGDACFAAGIESRTSSPVRILRNDQGESTGLSGLYPTGEGAGFAGGIMSAALDGMRQAEKIAAAYLPDPSWAREGKEY